MKPNQRRSSSYKGSRGGQGGHPPYPAYQGQHLSPWQMGSQEYFARQQFPGDRSTHVEAGSSSRFFGGIVAACGIGIIVATWLEWLSVSVKGMTATLTGMEIMYPPAMMNLPGNYLYRSDPFLLTGLWTLAVGAAVLVTGTLVFLRVRSAQGLIDVLGLVGATAALLNILSIYFLMGPDSLARAVLQSGGAEASVNAGLGLWLFLCLSIVVIASGYLCNKTPD